VTDSPLRRVEASASVEFAPLEWESYPDEPGPRRTPRNIVIASLAAAAYVKARTSKRCLTHAVELDAAGTPLRVLCGKVKLENILDDATQYDTHELDCNACVRKFGVDE
jgi:hypothetical protein